MRTALHVGQLLQRVPGGIGRYVNRLRVSLTEIGVEVVPFAAGDASAHRLRGWPDYVDLGHPYAPLRYELWHRLRWPPIRIDADVVHAPSLAVPPARPRPLVVTVNDVAFLQHPEVFTPRGIRFHERGLEIARREAAAVVVPSEFTRRELLAYGFGADRLFVATHGVEPPGPSDPEAEALRLRRVGVAPPYVLAVGTIEPRKGLPTLASAVEVLHTSHPDLRLVIAGPRGWGDVRGIDGAVVRELGAVDDDTLDALYRNAVACGIPSRYEGFGLPALEAMVRGCPVIASDRASLPEVVGDAGELLAPEDVTGWADVIASLLEEPARRAELVARGKLRAASFTWAASARAHLGAYDAARGIRATRS